MVLDNEFPPDLRVENEIEALAEAGHEVSIACLTHEGRPSLEKQKQVTIFRRPIGKIRYKSSVAALTFPMYFNFWRRFLNDLFKKHSFDIIHIHDLPLVRVGIEMKEKYNIPVVADLHENWPAYLRMSHHTRTLAGRILSPNKLWVQYEKSILRKTDHIIVVVEEAKERLISLGLDPDRITVVSNTINLSHTPVPERTEKSDIPLLFYAGAIHYHRGLQTVIEALARMDRTKYRLLALGEGRYRKHLINLAEKLGVQEYVDFPGWVPYQKVLKEMSRADYALIPHIKSDHTDSTIPHKLFQYMYAGIPVIASNCVPLERIINETKTGIIFPSEDAGRLADILESLDDTRGKEWGENGKLWVTKKYNWQYDAKRLISIYTR